MKLIPRQGMFLYDTYTIIELTVKLAIRAFPKTEEANGAARSSSG
jgi:hypothetical protein